MCIFSHLTLYRVVLIQPTMTRDIETVDGTKLGECILSHPVGILPIVTNLMAPITRKGDAVFASASRSSSLICIDGVIQLTT